MRKMTLLFAIIFTLLGTGCVIVPGTLHARPTTHVVVTDAPPQRVFHNGKWLYYRTNAYYYLFGTAWVYASTVPAHVSPHHATPRTRTTVRINRPNRHDVHHHQRMRPRR